MTKVKICGITNLDDALLSVKFGADALGFNFYQPSPRYIDAEMARSITRELPYRVSKVGVFVNETVERICETAEFAGLGAIQLHGDEGSDFVEIVRIRSKLTVIKALRVTPQFQAKDALDYDADAILLDAYSPMERGGTGEMIEWATALQVSVLIPNLYLAGGLAPENVGDAIRKVRPYAVDACSKLESAPGKKDADKLERFIAAVKETT